MITLSLVVPCYNESAVLHIFMTELKRVLDGLGNVKPEVIFVNDGSRDDTLSILRELHRSYPDIVRYYSLSRNFGKEGAMLAGLTHATGNYVAIMDADLQDPPALLPDMRKWVTEEGYDCVGTRRSTREGEPPVRSFFARCFYWLINKISDTKLESGARDYKLLSRRALQALLSLPERNRFSKGLYEWIGFRTKWLEYHNVERAAGETKWSFWKLFRYSLEGILAFSTLPLALASLLGLLFMAISFIAIVALSVRQIVFHDSVDGWTSMVCVILLLSGVQLFFLGVFGQYMAKMYTEIKQRPNFIIAESSDDEDASLNSAAQ